jgi:phosphoribosylformylglycinamidine cyclo-ligase
VSGPAEGPGRDAGAGRGQDRGSAYSSAGVDYQTLDAGKRNALSEALATSGLLAERGGMAVDESRGEPAFVFKIGGQTLAFVLETLGTKSIIARQLEDRLGASGFEHVAYDTVAAIVNDLCCVGAVPLVLNAYFATGSSDWYDDLDRQTALLTGWRRGCADAGAVWGGGESPSLSGLVGEADIELAGSAVGLIPPGRSPVLGAELEPGDEIVLVASSGLHTNGASLARMVSASLREGYQTRLASGRSFGEALLDPSLIYSRLVELALERRLAVHYLSHITGHGLLKLMRPRREFTYRIDRLPSVPEVLAFLVEQTGMDPADAYSTLNMGCGFAVYCASGAGSAVVSAASELGLTAHVAGRVEAGPRRVILSEVDVVFEGEALNLAPQG